MDRLTVWAYFRPQFPRCCRVVIVQRPPPRRTAPDCYPWRSSLPPCLADIAAAASHQTPFVFLFSLMAERTNFGGWGRFMKLLWWMLQAGQVAGSDVFPPGHIGFCFNRQGNFSFPKQGSPSPKV